ncbi:hypothetical protein A1O7_01113 [Cladophialophora yegresii CBS 114405]|uniref:EKC/KEOPS complex subunit GON7 n=1 Tax=Cladophialophora yegresii CBS 114405 TaxID=1182544 RepID=W9WIF2_9EURO|nr:uncharacterized protein A1O7_01113 [Cladophialophora yegresii CBS 114405]EXJ64775.1 hypothetical protein A1O7_01113 [Cladophialophora yegresii CBS 114405]
MAPTTGSSSASLSATYDSPSGHKTFADTITSPPVENDGSIDTKAKTTYLSELRASTRRLQGDINKFLTEKMEEDKKAAGQDGLNGASKQKSKDELEEENYGEEDAEDDT